MEMTKIMGKCGAGMASAWNGMKRTVGNTRQDGKIADEESRIAERYNAILEARKEIEAAEADKNIVKAVLCGFPLLTNRNFIIRGALI